MVADRAAHEIVGAADREQQAFSGERLQHLARCLDAVARSLFERTLTKPVGQLRLDQVNHDFRARNRRGRANSDAALTQSVGLRFRPRPSADAQPCAEGGLHHRRTDETTGTENEQIIGEHLLTPEAKKETLGFQHVPHEQFQLRGRVHGFAAPLAKCMQAGELPEHPPEPSDEQRAVHGLRHFTLLEERACHRDQ